MKALVSNNTCNGNCSQCGECCAEFLTITKQEAETITNYLKQHPEIKCQHHSSSSDKIYVLCPFNDQVTHRCLIYDARPKICRDFICSMSPKDMIETREHNCSKRGYYNKINTDRPTNIISFHALFFKDYQFDLRFRDLFFKEQGHYEIPLYKQKIILPMLVDDILKS